MKPFIKTNQWPEYCGNSTASVKKKKVGNVAGQPFKAGQKMVLD